MRLTLQLAIKDWRLFWADPRAAVLCFVVPIILASAFGLVFDKPQSKELRLQLAVVCESESPHVLAFAESLIANPRLDVMHVTRGEAERLVADRRPGVAVILPMGFTMPTLLGERPRLELLHHPLSTSECAWAEGALTEAMLKDAAGGIAIEPPFRTTTHAVSGASFNAYSHSFAGMTLQYLLFWGMESGLLLLRERQRGVWRRICAAPVPLRSILFGKALATALIALLQVCVTFLFGNLIFGVQIGSLPGFVLLALAISALSAATGLLVATLGGTEARARSVCILVILGVSMLGGLWLPAFLLPGWARDLATALPTTWAMNGLASVTWQERGTLSVLPSFAVVVAFAVVFLAIASQRLGASESRRRKGFGVA